MDHRTEEYDRDESSTASGDLEKDSKPVEESYNPDKSLQNPIGTNVHRDGGALEKQITAKSANPSVNNVSAIPNGGLRAWLQVLGAFFLFFNSWGIVNTFGVYQTYYETGILASSSASDISWVGSIQAFLLMLVGALTGPVYDAGYFRGLLLTGSFLVVFGQMMLSLCTEYYQVILAQAICIGLGCGCLFVPSVAILSTYFSTKIATAMGIAAAGSSLGGVIYPIIFYQLQPRIGFGWATRVIGFIILITLLLSNLVMKVRVLPAARRRILDLPAFKEPQYALFVAGSFITFMGLYSPFFYVSTYAIEYGITSTNLAFYLLAIINTGSVFGRIIPNLIADRTGPLNMIIPCCFLSGVLSLCLIPIRSQASLIAFCILYGFFSGALVSLPPTIFVHLSPNRGMIGTRMGMGFSIVSVGLLLGTPISGWILDGSSFTYVWVFGGCCVLIGSALMICSRIAKGGPGLMKKV